jgi:hypothetical protein
LTVDQAADVLGVTPEAVRGRIRRRTIAVEREAGRVYVVLDADQARQTTDQPTDRTQELIATLREQLQAERRANEENRRIIAALTQRIPAIEAPEDAPGSPESPGPSDTPTEASAGAQEATERPDSEAPRSWWRRMFGG